VRTDGEAGFNALQSACEISAVPPGLVRFPQFTQRWKRWAIIAAPLRGWDHSEERSLARPRRYQLAFVRRAQMLAQNIQHAPQRLSCAPEQLIADGERAQVFRSHL